MSAIRGSIRSSFPARVSIGKRWCFRRPRGPNSNGNRLNVFGGAEPLSLDAAKGESKLTSHEFPTDDELNFSKDSGPTPRREELPKLGKNRMAIRVFLASSRVVLLDGLQVLLEIQQDIKIIGKATNGHDAVRRIQKLRPEVAILEIGLIGLNGIEVSRKIGDLSPSTTIVMLSTMTSPESIFRALRAGARGYLSRDASGLEVVNAVRVVREGKRYLSPKITATLIGDYISERRSPSPLESLTSRERHILQLVVEGSSSADIAGVLALSPKTVDTYRSRINQKLGIHNLPALVKFAIQYGITSLE